MRRFLVTSLIAALAALASVSPAAAQSDFRAYQAVCEAQGGTYLTIPLLGSLCLKFGGTFSERELATQRRVCEAQGGLFISIIPRVTHCR